MATSNRPSRRPRRAAVHVVCCLVLSTVVLLVAPPLLGLLTGRSASVVESGSMAPLLRPGDILLSHPPAPALLEDGDVVVFTSDATAAGRVVHRLVGRNPDGTWTTKGDANPVADPDTVAEADITGVVDIAVPRVGLPAVWLAHREAAPLALWAGLLAAATVGAVWSHPGADRRRARRSGAAPASAAGRGPAVGGSPASADGGAEDVVYVPDDLVARYGRDARRRVARAHRRGGLGFVRRGWSPLAIIAVTEVALAAVTALVVWWTYLAFDTGYWLWAVFAGAGLMVAAHVPVVLVLASLEPGRLAARDTDRALRR